LENGLRQSSLPPEPTTLVKIDDPTPTKDTATRIIQNALQTTILKPDIKSIPITKE
jgi:hypothetical protein